MSLPHKPACWLPSPVSAQPLELILLYKKQTLPFGPKELANLGTKCKETTLGKIKITKSRSLNFNLLSDSF